MTICVHVFASLWAWVCFLLLCFFGFYWTISGCELAPVFAMYHMRFGSFHILFLSTHAHTHIHTSLLSALENMDDSWAWISVFINLLLAAQIHKVKLTRKWFGEKFPHGMGWRLQLKETQSDFISCTCILRRIALGCSYSQLEPIDCIILSHSPQSTSVWLTGRCSLQKRFKVIYTLRKKKRFSTMLFKRTELFKLPA